jgi:hypothetical protein
VKITRILTSGTHRSLTPDLAAPRRNRLEPETGRMKTDGRLARRHLKGILGDATFAVFPGCGHTIRKILARLRLTCADYFYVSGSCRAVMGPSTRLRNQRIGLCQVNYFEA